MVTIEKVDWVNQKVNGLSVWCWVVKWHAIIWLNSDATEISLMQSVCLSAEKCHLWERFRVKLPMSICIRYRLLHGTWSCQETCKSYPGMSQSPDSRSSCCWDTNADRKWKRCSTKTWLESAEVCEAVRQGHCATWKQARYIGEQCRHYRFHLFFHVLFG